jgi:hypothetical protein
MKIQRFNEKILKDVKAPIERVLRKTSKLEEYPIKCKFKNRVPDPGTCYVIDINFEVQQIKCSNEYSTYVGIDFDQVDFIPDIFIFNKYNL